MTNGIQYEVSKKYADNGTCLKRQLIQSECSLGFMLMKANVNTNDWLKHWKFGLHSRQQEALGQSQMILRPDLFWKDFSPDKKTDLFLASTLHYASVVWDTNGASWLVSSKQTVRWWWYFLKSFTKITNFFFVFIFHDFTNILSGWK